MAVEACTGAYSVEMPCRSWPFSQQTLFSLRNENRTFCRFPWPHFAPLTRLHHADCRTTTNQLDCRRQSTLSSTTTIRTQPIVDVTALRPLAPSSSDRETSTRPTPNRRQQPVPLHDVYTAFSIVRGRLREGWKPGPNPSDARVLWFWSTACGASHRAGKQRPGPSLAIVSTAFLKRSSWSHWSLFLSEIESLSRELENGRKILHAYFSFYPRAIYPQRRAIDQHGALPPFSLRCNRAGCPRSRQSVTGLCAEHVRVWVQGQRQQHHPEDRPERGDLAKSGKAFVSEETGETGHLVVINDRKT